jgi:hypothetical protein
MRRQLVALLFVYKKEVGVDKSRFYQKHGGFGDESWQIEPYSIARR